MSACLSPLAVLAPAVGEPVASRGDEPMSRTVDGATTKTVSVHSLDCGEVPAQRWPSVWWAAELCKLLSLEKTGVFKLAS